MTLGQYLALVTSFHSQRPRYMNMLAALLQPLVDAQAFLASLTAAFDLDTAVGVQLDIVGQWIGRTRYLQVPLTGVYFSFDDGQGPRTGFDQGVWQGPYDPASAIIAMDDDSYRAILKLQAIANEWDGTIASIQAAFNAVFPGVVVDDRGDVAGHVMEMEVLIPGIEMNSVTLAALEQDFPIKPSGVRTTIIESTLTTTSIFGFDVDGAIIGGFDHGSWGKIIQAT